jgi:lipoyl synthase
MPERVRKPEWLKISIGANERYTETKRIVESHCLHTICSSGRCPNMGECWGKGTATFMIGGNICTRCCKFCNTASGKPLPLDADEPTHVAESIALMKLSHAVVTSVDRDDLPDLGASHWVRTIREIKRLNPDTTVEVLIPDFQGRKELVAQVIDAQPEIISHNMETVRRISPLVRSAAKYETSLEVLRQIAESNTTTKSGIMVGLGETPEEVEELMDDLRRVGCHILTIGQYLQPTHKHYPVAAYITPKQFALYREKGLEKGFQQVESAPLVRSSYHAEKRLYQSGHPDCRCLTRHAVSPPPPQMQRFRERQNRLADGGLPDIWRNIGTRCTQNFTANASHRPIRPFALQLHVSF